MPAALTTLGALKTYLAQPSAWAQSTAYVAGDSCRASGNLYTCTIGGTSSGVGTGPTGTGAAIVDGGVTWKFLQPSLITDDATLTRLIGAVSDFFESYTDRTFASTSQTYTFSGRGGPTIVLPDYPVSAVSSVTIDGSPLAARASVGAAGWVLVPPNTLALDGGNAGPRFTRGIANVSVAYTAGYSTIPADLAHACLEACASWYKRRSRVDEASKSIQGEVISFSTDELPKAARSVLDLYRRGWPR